MLNGIYTQIDVINVQHMSMFEDVLFSSGIQSCSLQGRADVCQNLGSVPSLSTLHPLHFLLKLKEWKLVHVTTHADHINGDRARGGDILICT